MSVVYKSKKDVKEAKKKWNNHMLRQRNPAGYEAHVAAMNAFYGEKDRKGDKDGGKKKVVEAPDMADMSTYEGSDTQKELQDLIKDAQDAEPNPLLIDGASREDTKGKSQGKLTIEEANQRYIDKKYRPDNDLPDRPEAPTMPTIKLPGGITRTRVDNPSGLGGKSYSYEADGKSLYKDKGWNPKNTNYGDKSFKQRVKKNNSGRTSRLSDLSITPKVPQGLKDTVSKTSRGVNRDLKEAVKKTRSPNKNFKGEIPRKNNSKTSSDLGPVGGTPVKPKDSAFKGTIPKPPKKLSKAFRR